MRKRTHMKNLRNVIFVLVMGMTLGGALAIWSPVELLAAKADTAKMAMAIPRMEDCQAMQAEKQKLMEDSKAQDAEIVMQVARMNDAQADRKTTLMAAVLTRMVEQRAAMNVRRDKMQDDMMLHMMQHMEMGKNGMLPCPMMPAKTGIN